MQPELKKSMLDFKQSEIESAQRTSNYIECVSNYDVIYEKAMDFVKKLDLTKKELINAVTFVHDTIQNAVDATTKAQKPMIRLVAVIEKDFFRLEIHNNGYAFYESYFLQADWERNLEMDIYNQPDDGISKKSEGDVLTYGKRGQALLPLRTIVINECGEKGEFYYGDNLEEGFAITGMKLQRKNPT